MADAAPTSTVAGFPDPVLVRDAILGPLFPASHPACVAGFAETPGIKLTHKRADSEDGCLDRLEVHAPEGDRDGFPVVSGPALYAGPFFPHFGHMLAECIHRLWAAKVFPALHDAQIVFQGMETGARPGWVDPVLRLCGIDPARVTIVREPTRFETLYVPEQGRVLGGDILIPDYLSLFPLAPIEPAPSGASRRLYFSRSRHIHSGSYLGESLIEERLADAGFDILHPEEMALDAVVSRCAAAEMIVFAEGSAIHNLELCGPVDARILLIGRRGGTDLRFGRLLRPLCKELRIFPGKRASVCLDWETEDQPRRGRGCSFVDLPGLIAALSDFTGTDLPIPDEATQRDAVSRDLLRFLLDPRSGITSNNQQLGRALRAMREDPEIQALIAPLQLR